MLSKHQDLPEHLIEKFYKFVNWSSIAARQKLSETFIIKWSNYLNFDILKNNPYISPLILMRVKQYF